MLIIYKEKIFIGFLFFFYMVNIEISQKVKDILQKFKEKEQCKTFSEAIRLLLIYNENKNLIRLE